MNPNKGTVKLINGKKHPFNNSLEAVSLPCAMEDCTYLVRTAILASDGEVGDIEIFDKARNGFKICFTGSGEMAEILWVVEEEK